MGAEAPADAAPVAGDATVIVGLAAVWLETVVAGMTVELGAATVAVGAAATLVGAGLTGASVVAGDTGVVTGLGAAATVVVAPDLVDVDVGAAGFVDRGFALEAPGLAAAFAQCRGFRDERDFPCGFAHAAGRAAWATEAWRARPPAGAVDAF
ncbi:MAG TPA: hypothetical protein VMF14_11835 [Solirubrobacteraceae bacterium]|nr:hypothetical protein [Solirubrobacteraceae bacterium]